MNENNQVHVVIITALEKEKKAVLNHLNDVSLVKMKGREFHRATISTRFSSDKYNIILLSLSGMGNPNAAVATTQAIDVWNPQYIILTGIAGGVRNGDDRKLGDIIVAEQIVGYEPGRVEQTGTKRRFDVMRPAHNLLEAARKLPPEDWILSILTLRPDNSNGRLFPKVHFGIVASGDKVIADDKIITELQLSWPRLTGIEMEGYGAALAAYQSETAPGMLMIKAICDWADSSKNNEWQDYAADVAATFTVALLKSHPFSSVTKPQAIRKASVKYKGTSKIDMCRRLIEWEDLADYFDISLIHRKGFTQGRECQGIWEWLEVRDKLDGLPDGLRYIDREDLVDLLVPA